MRKIVVLLFASMLHLAPVPACCAGLRDAAPVTVSIDPPIDYRNGRGERVYVRYGRLSDGSLHFVKLRLPDGKEHTLPLAVSASGARYTDERELVWWEHHGQARVEIRGPNGDWTVKYEGLVPVDRPR